MHAAPSHITVAGTRRHAAVKACVQLLTMQAASEHAYLGLTPESPPQTCNVSLKLDDGTILPAHSRVLAQYSPVFRDMFDSGDAGAPAAASAASRVEVPLYDCPKEIATGFLSILYSLPFMSEAFSP